MSLSGRDLSILRPFLNFLAALVFVPALLTAAESTSNSGAELAQLYQQGMAAFQWRQLSAGGLDSRKLSSTKPSLVRSWNPLTSRSARPGSMCRTTKRRSPPSKLIKGSSLTDRTPAKSLTRPPRRTFFPKTTARQPRNSRPWRKILTFASAPSTLAQPPIATAARSTRPLPPWKNFRVANCTVSSRCVERSCLRSSIPKRISR